MKRFKMKRFMQKMQKARDNLSATGQYFDKQDSFIAETENFYRAKCLLLTVKTTSKDCENSDPN